VTRIIKLIKIFILVLFIINIGGCSLINNEYSEFKDKIGEEIKLDFNWFEIVSYEFDANTNKEYLIMMDIYDTYKKKFLKVDVSNYEIIEERDRQPDFSDKTDNINVNDLPFWEESMFFK
jgi:hypothetical protein